MSHTIKTEVVIIGAGLVGLSAAIAMHEAGHQVVLVDSKNPVKIQQNLEAEDAGVWDTRIYAISPKNAAWLMQLGVWQQLNAARLCAIQGMDIWSDSAEAPLSLAADDINAENLGVILESRALMAVLMAKVEALGITTLFDCVCETLQVTEPQSNLTLQSNAGQTIQLESALLLAADGSHSWVRTQLNFPTQQKSYAHTAVVANFTSELPHENIARQWFNVDEDGKLNILAWLPLPDHTISIVWSAPTAFAASLLQLDAEALAQKVAAAGQHLLGDFKLISPTAGFQLSLQTASNPVQDCVVLLGDAAHVVHPMAGQGVNLGFRDVVDLVEILQTKTTYQAINDGQLLKQYARVRKTDVAKMVLLTDGLYHVFSSQTGLMKKVRHWGFETTKHQQLKSQLVRQAVGL
jgi:2-octaprenylphenol hydroxylase